MKAKRGGSCGWESRFSLISLIETDERGPSFYLRKGLFLALEDVTDSRSRKPEDRSQNG